VEQGHASEGDDMSTAPKYRIATVTDFLKVPSDRIADCIAEFADYLVIMREIIEKASTLSGTPISSVAFEPTVFVWTDDGEHKRIVSTQDTGHWTQRSAHGNTETQRGEHEGNR
jgi:hypothetical protein